MHVAVLTMLRRCGPSWGGVAGWRGAEPRLRDESRYGRSKLPPSQNSPSYIERITTIFRLKETIRIKLIEPGFLCILASSIPLHSDLLCRNWCSNTNHVSGGCVLLRVATWEHDS